MITIHILSQQDNLLHSLPLQLLYLLNYRLYLSTPLPSPHEWHYTERTHVIAASHDGQICRYAIFILSDGCDVRVGLLFT